MIAILWRGMVNLRRDGLRVHVVGDAASGQRFAVHEYRKLAPLDAYYR